jgi:pimeloyl-ACP methyl ester carboxylesterase
MCHQRNDIMNSFRTPAGITISYDKYGSGTPLILVHGGFSDHKSNWELVREFLEPRYTIYAVARRGRGETDTTEGHALEDEFADVAALIRIIDEPVFMAGHSYGAHVALGATLMQPDNVRKLVLYEPPNPDALDREVLRQLEGLALVKDWSTFSETFFRDMLHVPVEVIEEMKRPPVWTEIVKDASASLGDVRAVSRHSFDAARFRSLTMPVLLQVGTESPRNLYLTDQLAAVLPDAHIEDLPGQAHEAPTTAPEMYADSLSRFFGAGARR